jgi:hypothetical protein
MMNVMTEPAKDITSIYSAYNLTPRQYIETTEIESYSQIKNKWLIFQSKSPKNNEFINIHTPASLKTKTV